jgi:sugar-specific transcriptional regulator TrmB
MHEEILEELGLSQNEARIYGALLELGESSITDISKKVNIHRRSSYDAIQRLVEKGLASPIIDEKEKRFVPVEPDKLLEILEEKRSRLQAALPEMQKLFTDKKVPERVYLYKGVEGYKNYLRDMLLAKEDVYTINAKGMMIDPRLQVFIENFWKEAKAKNIVFHALVDEAAKEQVVGLAKKFGADYRIMPKQYSSPMTIDIYGDRVVTVVGEKPGEIAGNVTIFMNVSPELADSYRQLFSFIWDHCKAT